MRETYPCVSVEERAEPCWRTLVGGMAGAACRVYRVHKGLWNTANVSSDMPANEEGTGSVMLLLVGFDCVTGVPDS